MDSNVKQDKNNEGKKGKPQQENKPVKANEGGKKDKPANDKHSNFANILKDAKEGEVVTRFPPEPSGYLHIGHVKAVMLNYHYSKMYKGKMILRYDDTNSQKEKLEYAQSIQSDLKRLNIVPDQITHTSDHFDKLMEIMTKMISEGKCYCDNISQEEVEI